MGQQRIAALAMVASCILFGAIASPLGATPQALQDHPTSDSPPVQSTDQLLGRSRPPGSEARVFVEAELRPRTPFVGQQAIYTVWLHTRHRVSQVRPVSLPQFSGSWVREIAAPSGGLRTQPVTRSGQRYWRASVLRRAIFALGPAEHHFAPIVLDLVVAVPERGLFGRLMERPRSLREASGAVRWRAKPLPPPPPDFSGAVGALTLISSLEPQRVQVGEAAVLTVTLRSTANLFPLPQPEIAKPAAVDLHPPEDRIFEEFRQGLLWTERSWRFVLVARTPGSWRLPAAELVYFDPATEEYARATGEPLALQALARSRGSLVGPGEGPRAGEGDPSRHRGWIWLGVLLAAGLLAVGGMWRRGDRQLLAALKAAQRPSTPRGRIEAVEDAWADYLDRRWGIGIHPPTSWSRELSRLRVGAAIVGRLDELAGSLRLARAAPTLSDSTAVVEELLNHSSRLARQLGR